MATLEKREELRTTAAIARAQAYAPYSRYTVGAAVLGGNGMIYHGVNVENASFGLTICAERNAIAGAVAHGVRVFDELAVIGPDDADTTPCGACRQVLAEFAAMSGAPVLRISCWIGRQWQMFTIDELLPNRFLLP